MHFVTFEHNAIIFAHKHYTSVMYFAERGDRYNFVSKVREMW